MLHVKPIEGIAIITREVQAAPRRRVSAEQIALDVVTLIGSRGFQPGDRLREQELADRFNVSRGPVREALRILEARSIVHIEPMRGATITRLKDDEVLDAVAAAGALFGLVCRLACERRTNIDIAKIAEKISQLETICDEYSSPRQFFTQTLRVGRAIGQAACSPRLMRMVEDTRFGAPDYFGPLGFTSEKLRQGALRNWKAIQTAITERDATVADDLGRKIHHDALAAALLAVA